jgi:Cys-tRNA(Pro)/Cys-tRNA(Cys) deacylase
MPGKAEVKSKTNAMRLLDAAAIPYETRTYTVDLEDLSAETVATKIGFSLDSVFKTLLVHAEGEFLFAVIPASGELNRKALAKLAGHRSVELAPLKDLERLTGYVRGGVTVPGARKAFRTFVDETIELHDLVSVSAGVRGMQLILKPADYLRVTEAVTGAIAT